MKTKEELNTLKKEVEALNTKLSELSEEELAQIVGGASGCVDSLRGAQECDEYLANAKQVAGGFVPKTEPVMSPSGENDPFDCSGYYFKLD